MNAMIPMYVHTTNFVADRVEAIKERYQDKDRGASLVEYAGLIVLAVIILGAIYYAFNASKFGSTLKTAIGNILNGHGNSKGFSGS